MTRRLDPSVLPPESGELPGALAGLLAEDERVQTLMPEGVAVYEYDEAVPGEAPSVPWLRLVVREPVLPYGQVLGPSLHRRAPVELVAEASEDGPQGWSPRRMIAAAHAAAYAALVGQNLADLRFSHHVGEVVCTASPSTAAYDADARLYYAKAVYRLHLAPLADRPQGL